jgi:sec-independent protein translocase protein TatA
MVPGIILFLESLGGGELLVILLFVLLFFGSKNIPNLARGLGKGIREFKDAMNGVQSEIRQGMYEIEKQTRVEDEPAQSAPAPAATSPDVDAAPAQPETPPATPPLPSIQPEERAAAR